MGGVPLGVRKSIIKIQKGGKMKKTIFGFLFALAAATASTNAMADFDVDIYGRVTGKGAQSIAISSFGESREVLVSPWTKVEVEVRGLLHYDYDGTLDDVTVGDWVKIEAVPNAYGEFYAKEIEIVR